jgi:hypothetical protein
MSANKEIKQYDYEFSYDRFLLGIKSCTSSETAINPKKKHGGWKAMPYILGM